MASYLCWFKHYYSSLFIEVQYFQTRLPQCKSANLVTFVCRSKSPTGLILFLFTYSTLNKVSMSKSMPRYENMPIQHSAICHGCKNDNFQLIFLLYSYFLLKT